MGHLESVRENTFVMTRLENSSSCCPPTESVSFQSFPMSTGKAQKKREKKKNELLGRSNKQNSALEDERKLSTFFMLRSVPRK